MVTFLIDFEIAYDTIKWTFFEGTMHKVGFSKGWVTWIHVLYINIWLKMVSQ